MIRVLLVDDHTAVRQALRVMLEAEPDLEVVGEAGSGDEGVRACARARPDVTLVDLKMPGSPGLAAIPQLLAAAPKSAAIVFTMYDSPAYVQGAIAAGASGYVLKSATREELLRAVRAVHAGAGFLHDQVSRPLLRRLVLDARRGAAPDANLSPREIQVLELCSEGRSNRGIAGALAISEETVKTYLKRLYEKLGASDRAQAVAIALRQQLIE